MDKFEIFVSLLPWKKSTYNVYVKTVFHASEIYNSKD